MKVLFIGNSHTYFNDMPYLFQKICEKSGIAAEVAMLAHGGKGLDFHQEQPEVRFNILYGNYDFIVLQHVAHPFGDEAAMFQSARGLYELIAKTRSKTVLYMTWSEKQNEPGQARMADAYLRLGKELSAVVAPVGLVWWRYHHEAPDRELYHTDGEHASPAGSALAAYTLFSAITQKRAVPLSDRDDRVAEIALEETLGVLH